MTSINKARSERWRREDEAPRLKDKVPNVAKLRLDLEEMSEDRAVVGTRRVRHIVVDQAAALFEIPCSDSKCEEGGHDVTPHVMSELSQNKETFEFTDACHGYVATRPCGRVLKIVAQAEYKTTGDS
jgi:hypothetical protein